MKIGFTASSFDLLHAGHIAFLEACKTKCDYLIVGLQTDPTIDRPTKNKPIQTILERYIQIHGVNFVDEVIPYSTEEDLENLIGWLHTTRNLSYRFLGNDYDNHDNFTGKHYCILNDIEIVFIDRKFHSWSSSELRDRIVEQCK